MAPSPTSSGSRSRARAHLLAATLVAAAAAALGAGCGAREGTPDLVNGKALFVERCGSCHVLDRAGTAGKTGPNLDAAFGPARRDGLGGKTIAGVTYDQVLYPGRGSGMPAKLVIGKDARDVAAYVGSVAGVPGEDKGALATAGLAGATDPRQIFTAAGCGGCHRLSAAGATGTIGPSLDDLAAAARRSGKPPQEYVRQAIMEPNADIAPGYQPGVMPQNYASTLTPEQVKALTEFLLNP